MLLDLWDEIKEFALNTSYGYPRQWEMIYEKPIKGGIQFACFMKRPRGSRICGTAHGIKFVPSITLQPAESMTIEIPIETSSGDA